MCIFLYCLTELVTSLPCHIPLLLCLRFLTGKKWLLYPDLQQVMTWNCNMKKITVWVVYTLFLFPYYTCHIITSLREKSLNDRNHIKRQILRYCFMVSEISNLLYLNKRVYGLPILQVLVLRSSQVRHHFQEKDQMSTGKRVTQESIGKKSHTYTSLFITLERL